MVNFCNKYTISTAAYSGHFCEEDRNGCSEIQCFDGVDCVDAPAPEEGASCGPCPSGFTGDGEKCLGSHSDVHQSVVLLQISCA